jgi:hypothetical protein
MGSKLPYQPRTVPMEVLVLGLSRTGTMCSSFLPSHSIPYFDFFILVPPGLIRTFPTLLHLPAPLTLPLPHSNEIRPPRSRLQKCLPHDRNLFSARPPRTMDSCAQREILSLDIRTIYERRMGQFAWFIFRTSFRFSQTNLPMLIPQSSASPTCTNTRQAVTDLPSAGFTPELLALYPTAKIILTTRQTHLWHASILSTIHVLHSSPLDRFFLLFRSTHTKSLSKLWSLIVQYYFKGSIVLHGKEVFEEHTQMVRDLAKKNEREFLEFR